MQNPLRKYLRKNSLPHFFCPGCGAAQVMSFFVRVADKIGLDFDKLVAIGGVGCTARIPVYLDVEAMHGVHGRTLPWATGIKLHNPDLQVVIFAGDGDAAAIGGNHLIQAARRNLDVTMILVNNLTFGMTGGQAAPTTPPALNSSTTPYGSRERPFDLCKLAISAGATMVSRWTTARPQRAMRAMEKALRHKGFSLVEIVSQCPTNFGRPALGSGDAIKGLEWIRDCSLSTEQAQDLTAQETLSRFILGDFIATQEPIFEGSSVYPQDGGG